MRSMRSAGLLGVGILCAAGSLPVIGYFGAPLVRTALTGFIGFFIVTEMVVALRAARRGELVRHHRRVSSAREPELAPVHYLPHASTAVGEDADNPDVTEVDLPHPVIRPTMTRQ